MPSFRSSHGPHTCGSMSSSSSDNFVHALKKVLPTCTARHSFLPFAFLVLARAMPTRGCNGSPTTWLQGQPDHLAGNRTRCLLLKVTLASAVTAVATAFCHGSTVLDRYALCSNQKLRGSATFLLSPPSSACRFPSNPILSVFSLCLTHPLLLAFCSRSRSSPFVQLLRSWRTVISVRELQKRTTLRRASETTVCDCG